jgi:hypothetical protein
MRMRRGSVAGGVDLARLCPTGPAGRDSTMPQDEPGPIEHHILPVLKYKMNTSDAYTTADAGTAFTFGSARQPWLPAGIASSSRPAPMRPTGSRSAAAASRRHTNSARLTTSAVTRTASIWRSAGLTGHPAELSLWQRTPLPGASGVEIYSYPFWTVVPDQTFSHTSP